MPAALLDYLLLKTQRRLTPRLAVAHDAGIRGCLTDLSAAFAVASIARVADAFVAAVRVGAPCVGVTVVQIQLALVNI